MSFIKPYNSTAALTAVINEQPVYANFAALDPPITIVGFDYNECQIFLKFSVYCFIFLTVTLGLVVWIGLPVYMVKARQLKKTSKSNKIFKMNVMLLYALLAQCTYMQLCWCNLAFILGGLIYSQYGYGSLIAQIYGFFPMFYPILEIMALFALVKPYRVYIESEFYGLKIVKWVSKTIYPLSEGVQKRSTNNTKTLFVTRKT